MSFPGGVEAAARVGTVTDEEAANPATPTSRGFALRGFSTHRSLLLYHDIVTTRNEYLLEEVLSTNTEKLLHGKIIV